jgi:hypothetical protein
MQHGCLIRLVYRSASAVVVLGSGGNSNATGVAALGS